VRGAGVGLPRGARGRGRECCDRGPQPGLPSAQESAATRRGVALWSSS